MRANIYVVEMYSIKIPKADIDSLDIYEEFIDVIRDNLDKTLDETVMHDDEGKKLAMAIAESYTHEFAMMPDNDPLKVRIRALLLKLGIKIS